MGKIVRVQAITVNLKKKVVLKIATKNHRSRAKSMKCVASEPGVFSVSQDGDKMTVVGEINPVTLTMLLRKKMRCVSLEVVTPVEEKKEEKEKKEKDAEVKSNIQPENVQDRLLLWRLSHTQKDGSLSSEEAKQKWKLACKILAEKSLIPEDENIEENERAFKAVMESEHPNSMVYKDVAITYSNLFSNMLPELV